MPQVTVRYWAAAKAAAGIAEETVAGTTLGEVLECACARHGTEFALVLARCSFLVDGVRADPSAVLHDAAVIELLPPFAGG